MAFDRAWLDLREPADIQARSADLLGRSAALLDEADCVAVDLAAGTGATVRAFAPLLRRPVHWRLVDHDPALLLAAAATFAGQQVEMVQLDLAQLSALPLGGASLVTASAFFDLCSASFAEKLASHLAQLRLGLYVALTYDGTILWDAPHRYDKTMVELFNTHQQSNKGFGPAMGLDASRILTDTFVRLGYDVTIAYSPWRLSQGFRALQAAFIEGIVTAVDELQEIEPSALRMWRQARLELAAAGASCQVGHFDILAQPPVRW